ncbi:hypothetical protein CSC2_26750 [Clostridium zeae]|uniref:Uncharacterized protein n=1 Tax=Clostridium zeae TaxID=2759022 RepID=A0ABQ1EBE1_9CLOT|nr:Ig-like domain-containing protein [Clostridium zeae]GFZ32149.1 hypothetical protein CSC2_26750 [Clostridium zeae]
MLNINTLSLGNHNVRIESIGNDGVAISQSRNFSVSKLPAIVQIDNIPNNSTFNDDFTVSGWALNSSGAKSVSILVDGSFKGYALTGISRPDIKGNYPNYPSADASGFDYTVGIWELSNGAHTVTAVVTGNDGSTAQHAVDFTVNKSNTGSIDMQISITKSFCAGFVDAIAENFLGLYKMISSPIQTLVTLDFLVKAAKDISSPEGQQLIKIVGSELEDIANQFKNGDANVRARLVGRAVGEIFIFFIGPKGITKTLDILGNYAKYNKLGELVISKSGQAAAIIEGAAEAITKITSLVKTKIDDVIYYVKKVTKFDNYYEVVTPDGSIFRIAKEEIPTSNIAKIDNIASTTAKAETVWDSIKATQPLYEGTEIPRSFEMNLGDKTVWVHGNATEHMYEDVAKVMAMPGTDPKLYSQFLLTDLQGTLKQATQNGVIYDQIMNVGKWELKFSPPREAGQLPALIHSVFKGWGA